MDIQIVHHEVPLPCLRVRRHHPLHMCQKVRFRPCWSQRRSDDLPRHDISAQDAGTCAVPNVLELPPFHLAWCQWQARMLPFQRLDASQFIRRDDAVSLLG